MIVLHPPPEHCPQSCGKDAENPAEFTVGQRLLGKTQPIEDGVQPSVMHFGFKAGGTVFHVAELMEKSGEVTHEAPPFIVAQDRPSKGRRGSGAMMLHPELLVKTPPRAYASKAGAGVSSPSTSILLTGADFGNSTPQRAVLKNLADP